MGQETEGIDLVERERRDNGERGDIEKGKGGLVDEGSEEEIQSIGTGRWVGSDNKVDSVELSLFIFVSLYFSSDSSLSL